MRTLSRVRLPEPTAGEHQNATTQGRGSFHGGQSQSGPCNGEACTVKVGYDVVRFSEILNGRFDLRFGISYQIVRSVNTFHMIALSVPCR